MEKEIVEVEEEHQPHKEQKEDIAFCEKDAMHKKLTLFYWTIENDNILKGGFLKAGQNFRLRHYKTGKYLNIE